MRDLEKRTIFFTSGIITTDAEKAEITKLKSDGSDVEVQNGAAVPRDAKPRPFARVAGNIPAPYAAVVEARKAAQGSTGVATPPPATTAEKEFAEVPVATPKTKKKVAKKKVATPAAEDDFEL